MKRIGIAELDMHVIATVTGLQDQISPNGGILQICYTLSIHAGESA